MRVNSPRNFSILLMALLVAAFYCPDSTDAAIVTDGTMGRAGGLTGPNYAITAEHGTQRGGNLFHSFSQFNLVNNDTATFSGPSSINNIISRVTGGSPSSIDGTISSTIPGANLYFINPYGIMFGPNARLDISGSFHATSADYLKLGTDGRLDARVPDQSLLTSAPPSAFGFVTASPAAITFSGTFLQTGEGKNIVVVGGDMILTNTNLYAPAGNIEIVSAASAGQAELTDGNISGNTFTAFGMLSLGDFRAVEDIPVYSFSSDRTIGTIDSSGASTTGNITIRGRTVLLSNAQISNRVFGDQQGGAIRISADNELNLDNYSVIRNNSLGSGTAGDTFIETAKTNIHDNSVIMSSPYAGGKGGNLSITASDSLTLASGGAIEVSARDGTGNAGNVTISTSTINIDGYYTGISSSTLSAGNGGTLNIKAVDSINMSNGGSINVTAVAGSDGNAGSALIETAALNIDGGFISGATLSSGKGGILDIKATDSIHMSAGSYIYIDSNGTGDAGTLTIRTGTLNIDGLGSITSETLSSGKGGVLTIKAADSINLKNKGSISISAWDIGDGGVIDIETTKLNIDGGFIAGSTYSSSGKGGDIIINASDLIHLTNAGSISVDTRNAGESGTVSINTPSLNIDSYSYVSGTTWSSGKGGTLAITASDAINISSFGEIAVKTGGSGAAGTAVIDTAVIKLDNGSISGSTFSSGKGGGVEIKASDSILINNQGYIAVTAVQGTGDAGDISITTKTLRVDDDGYISGSTSTSGKGGNLEINATDSVCITTAGSIFVDAHASGDSGTIAIKTNALKMDGFLSYISGLTWSSGTGGKLDISAKTVELSNLASIASGSQGTGAAGDLTISATDSIRMGNSSITAETVNSDGGSITIDPALVDLHHSSITTSVKGGTGNGGNINLAAHNLVLDNSSIIANAEGGNGGNINLTTGALIKSATDSVISASSRLGLQGSVFISSPVVDIGASLTDVPGNLVDISALAPKRCASTDEEISSFTVQESAGIAPNPDRPIVVP